jgi:hypothetical protein
LWIFWIFGPVLALDQHPDAPVREFEDLKNVAYGGDVVEIFGFRGFQRLDLGDQSDLAVFGHRHVYGLNGSRASQKDWDSQYEEK